MNETSTQRRAKPWSRADRDPDGLRAPSTPATEVGSLRPTSGRFWGVVGLAILTAVTSLVVATISVWLTPIYMTAMVLIFVAPRSTRPASSSADTDVAPPEESSPASPEVVDVPGEDADRAAADAEAAAPATDAAEPTPPKPRKRRGKGKRAAKAAALAEASSTQPTWIRVGPGKFVRADVQAQPVDADPPQQAEGSTETETEPRPDAEAVPTSEHDAPEVAGEVVDPETDEETQTPAEAIDPEPFELDSTAPADADEAAEWGDDGGYGIAPSAPVEDPWDEGGEYGIAPSAPVEAPRPEAAPLALSDDESHPDEEPSFAPTPDAPEETPEEVHAEVEPEADADEDAYASLAGDAARSNPSPLPTIGRPASDASGMAAGSGLRPVQAALERKASHVQEARRRDRTGRTSGRPRTPSREGRTRVRELGRPGRDADRSHLLHRRHHPRSPPRRA